MRLLVLGGTRFLGRAVVDAALSEGTEVTTFTRGESGEPPPQVEALHGDRTDPESLDALRGRDWDLVVDTSGYVPSVVGRSAELLADRVGHYVFVSTMNVYPNWPDQQARDDSPTHDCPPDAGPDDGDYGFLKTGCERAVERHFAGRCTQARAGLIIGPHDNSGRLPWWVRRVAGGGEVLAPGDPGTAMSLVDARDLALWFLHCGRAGVSGRYVATAPAGQTSFGEVLDLCRQVTGSDARFTWVPDEVLVAHEVGPWVELPLWLPVAEHPHTWDADTSGARAAGLTCRPIAESLADVWEWLCHSDPPPRMRELPEPGMSPEREREILAAWRAR